MAARSRFRLPALAAALLLSVSAGRGVAAQALVLDEGTFSLLRDGTRIGREDFGIRITRGGVGGAFVAQANILLRDRRQAVILNADSLGTPLRMQIELREQGSIVQSVVGELDRGIWSGRVVHRDGESARAFRLPMDTFIVEEGVVHQLWFLVRFGEGRPVTLFTPSVLSQLRVLVQEEAPDRVALGLREIVARHWSVRVAGTGTLVYDVWTDAAGRLLRVIDHGAGLEALRDEPPAETRPGLRS